MDISLSYNEIEKLIPDALKVLAEDGHGTLVKDFFQLLYETKFPLKNTKCIAFRLWADVIQWFTLKDTRCMRYWDGTLQFFWLEKTILF
jgi:hypothetical protein